MNQEKIDAFMLEYKRLCQDFGMSFQFDLYDQLVLRDDINEEDIDCNVNLERFKATMNKQIIPEPPMFGPITKEQFMMNKMMTSLKNDYMTGFAEHFNTPTILEQIRDAKGNGKPIMMRYGRTEVPE